MSEHPADTFAAFLNDSLLRSGPLTEVLAAIKLADVSINETVLVFNNATGQQVDFDMRGSLDEVIERAKAVKPSKGPGRPRLGVESREVSLLPKHWSWLEQQPSGISATMRKLVEEKMRVVSPDDQLRRTRDATYKIMSALAGNRENFEEASRALYAGDQDKFASLIEHWPADIKKHLQHLLQANG